MTAELKPAPLLHTPSIATPAARWRERCEPDPHETIYDCERAWLTGGHMTDDEIANAVYLEPTIMNLIAAKHRIRWLSRRLAAALAVPPRPAAPAPAAPAQFPAETPAAGFRPGAKGFMYRR